MCILSHAPKAIFRSFGRSRYAAICSSWVAAAVCVFLNCLCACARARSVPKRFHGSKRRKWLRNYYHYKPHEFSNLQFHWAEKMFFFLRLFLACSRIFNSEAQRVFFKSNHVAHRPGCFAINTKCKFSFSFICPNVFLFHFISIPRLVQFIRLFSAHFSTKKKDAYKWSKQMT